MTDLCCLYVADISKEDASHIHILWSIVVVEVVVAVALLLPGMMALRRTRCLSISPKVPVRMPRKWSDRAHVQAVCRRCT
jgi:hypothetical protein